MEDMVQVAIGYHVKMTGRMLREKRKLFVFAGGKLLMPC